MFVLMAVTIGYFNDRRQREWKEQLWVTIYPINGEVKNESRDKVQQYIDSRHSEDFAPIEIFIAEQAHRWELEIDQPVIVNLGPVISDLPPERNGHTRFDNALYSLQLRFWDWRHATYDQPEDIRIYVIYFDTENHVILPHSLGLNKGNIGLVYAFASRHYSGSNKFIISHELLHTLGATDKYDPTTNQPQFPHGFANQNQDPLFPQSFAEIMGGKIPLSEHESVVPENLDQVMIGVLTATEIGWYP
jgi:hypothetical protein